jgi:hypothetical protein
VSTKLKALILTPVVGGLAALAWAAFASALTATDSGTTMMKSMVPIIIGVATLISMIVEAIVF